MIENNDPVEFKFPLGIKVKDVTCGFVGIIIGRTQHLNGCLQYTVTPKMKSLTSDRKDAWTLDEGQLVRVSGGITEKKVKLKPVRRLDTGGPPSRAPNSRVRS